MEKLGGDWSAGAGVRTVYDDDVASPHALFAEYTGQHLDFVEQLAVRVFLGRVRDGRLPNNSDVVAAAGGDMAIHAVVGGGDLAIREPGPMFVLDPAGQGLGLAEQSA